MTTYVTPIDSETDPDAPLTSQLGKRWDNNLISVLEGDVTAPKMVAGGLDVTEVTASLSLGAGTTGYIALDPFTFFPSVNFELGATLTNSASPSDIDVPTLFFDNKTVSTKVADVKWRRVNL